MSARHPKWPITILNWLCKPGYVEEIEGDLIEDFQWRLERRGRVFARFMFCMDALGFLRPRMIKSKFTLINTAMIRSYIVMSFRSMSKKPLFTLINLFGLAIGLASVIVIAGYVLFVLSYDRQYENSKDIYRVAMNWIDDNVAQSTAQAVAPVARALDKTLHGVKKVVRVYAYSGLVSRDGIEKTRETRFCYADSLFFELFNIKQQRGVLATSLVAPYSVVLTEKMALKYYGTTDIVGQELVFEDERGSYRFNVTAVVDNFSQNTHMNPDFIASMTTLDKMMPWYNNWHYPPMYAYIQAATDYDRSQLETEINSQIKKNHPPYIKENERSYFIQPIADIHLHSNLGNEWQANSNFIYVKILIVVAAFILFLACINYVNLSTARGTERSREVGVRKVMGAIRNQLIKQFLGESFVTTLIALVVAVGLAEIIFQFYLNGLLEKDLSVFSLFRIEHVLSMIGGLIILTLVAGIYPAFFLSHYRPSSMLQGKNSRATQGLQRSLVVFQFVISCLLIIGMFIIQRQTTYMREKNLGFDKDQLIAIMMADQKLAPKYRVLKDQLVSESVVKHVAVSATFPMKDGFNGWPITPEGHSPEENMSMQALSGDLDIVKTLNLELVTGRDFSVDNPADTTQAFIINEAAAKSLDWNDPVGKDFELTFYASRGAHVRKGKVIGMVKDFHFESLYNRIDPLVIFVNTHPYYCDYLLVKLGPGNLNTAMDVLEANWKKFAPDRPFEYSIADDDLRSLYVQETKLSSMFSSFTILSILVSCLGLFGLSAYTIGQRLKEIGVRKVLGATVGDLFALLSKEYMVLIMAAQVIAWPLAWWFSREWLNSFAYRVEIPYEIFLVTLMAGLLFGIISISLHIFRAVRANPSATLRIE